MERGVRDAAGDRRRLRYETKQTGVSLALTKASNSPMKCRYLSLAASMTVEKR
jgi:hypothetical protein